MGHEAVIEPQGGEGIVERQLGWPRLGSGVGRLDHLSVLGGAAVVVNAADRLNPDAEPPMIQSEASHEVTLRGRPKRERRRHPRAITNFSAILIAHLRAYSSRVINLSMGGALLDLGRAEPVPAIQVGDPLSLDIRCRGGSGPLRVHGRAVLWNETAGAVPLLAIQFEQMSDESTEILEDLMFEALAELRGRIVVATH